MFFGDDLIEKEIINIIYLLVVAISASIIVKRIRFHYTIALILVGLAISVMQIPIEVEFNPEVLMLIFLPALIFEGAYHMDFQEFKRNIKPVWTLAIFGVLISTAVVGLLLNRFLGMPLAVALLFGAIISPTDPISVLAIFKKFGAPKRLSTIIEGESMFNDGVGIVLFTVMLGLISTGTFSLASGIISFLTVVFGGVILGGIIGFAGIEVMKRADDHLIDLLITIIVAYGGFVLGESLHVSGIITIAMAGLIIGGNKAKIIRPSGQLAIFTFWEFAAFIINSFVFLLIGLKLNPSMILANLHIILYVSLMVLAARFLSVYLISGFLNRLGDNISRKWRFVISLSGLRGTIPIALVLGLPATFSHLDFFVSIVFGVVAFSLVVMGLCLGPIMGKLKLRKRTEKEFRYEMDIGSIIGYKKGIDELDRLFNSGRISKKIYDKIRKSYTEKIEGIEEDANKLFVSEGRISEIQRLVISRDLLIARKSAIKDAEIKGLISAKVADQLMSEIDQKLVDIDIELEEKM
ncbi:Na+/H+ antiporter [Candidatus Micrarchaeota archaeon RBG_16_49_10]|nr:MAG: Na+/H+ antiporter [Candidatus Micrarchaeota archaeon RBG_16_49_10]